MDAPCCFNAFGSAFFLQNEPVSVSVPSVVSYKKNTSRSVATSTQVRKPDRGASSSPPQMMFRNVAALLYRSMARKPNAEPESASSKVPTPDFDSDSGEEEDEELAEELECLEEEAITGEHEGRDPGDYDRRAHLFDESSRVFLARKARQAHQHHHRSGS